MTAPSWMLSALCAQTDPDLFFPHDSGDIAKAKKICGRCTVREECLQWAYDNDEEDGIYGGLTNHRRAKLALAKK